MVLETLTPWCFLQRGVSRGVIIVGKIHSRRRCVISKLSCGGGLAFPYFGHVGFACAISSIFHNRQEHFHCAIFLNPTRVRHRSNR